VSPFDRDRYEGRRYDGDRDNRRTYGNSFNGDHNRNTGAVTTRNVGTGNRDGNQFNNGFGRR
jgi:hypothetical protein